MKTFWTVLFFLVVLAQLVVTAQFAFTGDLPYTGTIEERVLWYPIETLFVCLGYYAVLKGKMH